MPMEEAFPRFWSKQNTHWNFGDAISYFLSEYLLVPFVPYSKRPWTTGSVLFDGAPLIDGDGDNAALPSFLNDRDCEAVFWGCGLRDPASLSPEFAEHSAILGVRGPLSASALRLGADFPLGDPGLFLPALYKPRKREAFVGKTVCVPHYLDRRNDEQILAKTGCDVVLRPAIQRNLESVERFIDALCSADFVLCGALHGAITAAGYSVPFAFWDNGNIDAPFKWADFAALIGIPCAFQASLGEAQAHYESFRPAIRIPSMWPLLCAAPGFVRPDGLMKVLRHELNRRGESSTAYEELLTQLEENTWQVNHLTNLSRHITDVIVPALVSERDLRASEVEAQRRQHEIVLSEAGVDLDKSKHEALALAARVEEVAQEKASLENRLAEAILHSEALARRAEDELAALNAERQIAQESARALRHEKGRADEALAARAVLEKQLETANAAIQQANERVEEVAGALNAEADRAEAADAALRVANVRAKEMLAALDAERKRSHDAHVTHQEETAQTHQVIESERSSRVSAAQHVAVIQGDLISAQQRLSEATGKIGGIVRRVRAHKLARVVRKMPIIAKYDARLQRNTQKIMAFLGRFSDTELGVSADGREDRVVAYLLSMTSSIADMPLLDRKIYRALHSDVRDAKIDPFVHYVDFGHQEGRSPHPLLDHAFYTGRYPETARYEYSILEHYLRFGAAKSYDPCELFSTSNYLSLYPDLRQTKYNPLLHYLRHPDCQPGPQFDSHAYRVNNSDVVRTGVNPLTHYLLWGRTEGRRALPSEPVNARNNPPRQQATPRALLGEKASSTESAAISGMSTHKIVVMMDAFYPQPDQDSGSLDQTNYVRIFQKLGYEVAFASVIDFTPSEESKRALVELGVTCITGADYTNVEEFVFLNAERISAFFLSRFNFGGSWIEKARTFCPDAQVIFNTVDLHHVREERKARVENDVIGLQGAAVTKQAELGRITAADVTVVVSEVERELLEDLVPAADVRVIPLIREVRQRALPSFRNRAGIAFIGGFQHQPNIDAVTTFVEVMWPKVLAARPDMTFHVIGSHMPEALSERTDPNVEWVGYVPELEPWLDRIKLTVAPLRYGAGAKGKVVSSLLNGVPVVASQVASEGMGFAEGVGMLVADDPDAFVANILALYDQEARWQQVSGLGIEAVRAAYSFDRGVALVEQFLPRAA